MASIYQAPEDYIELLIASIQAGGSKLTDFHVGGATRSFFEAQAVGLSAHSLILDQMRRDMHLATAAGEALDARGNDLQVARKAGVVATGTVTISRPAAGAAVTIPAGWAQLLTQPAPGQTPIAFQTTEDAVFAGGDTSKTVAAVALTVGAIGNIASGTVLYPNQPVSGFQTDGGFAAGSTFAAGVDVESDDAYRKRIPIEVQGRVNGTDVALEAGALSVPGVSSANVLVAGATRANGSTVPAGSVEVYYQGSSGLLTAVQSAAGLKSTSNQNVTAFTAAIQRLVVNCTVFAKTGTDTAALAAAVAAAIQAIVNATGVGNTVYLSSVVQAIDALTGVIGVTVPFTDFRKFTDGAGSSSSITPSPDLYADLQLADCTVAVSLIA